MYVARKKNILNKIESQLTLLGNKKRFMEDVISGDIKLFKTHSGRKVAIPTDELVHSLSERKYDRIIKQTAGESEESEESEGPETNNKHGYEYLMGMQFRSITAENINKLSNDIASLIERQNELRIKSEASMWLDDINQFEIEYRKFLNKMSKEKTKKKRKK